MPTLRPSGARIRIDGQFLPTRYFSLQLYGVDFNIIDAVADYQLIADPGSQSTLNGITTIDPLVKPGGHFTAYIEFSDKPAQPAPNTLYAGASLDSTKRLYLSLRAYLPSAMFTLPVLTFESPSGDQAFGTTSTSAGCAAAELVATPIVDLEAIDTSLPAIPPLLAGRHSIAFSVYRGIAGGLAGPGIAYNENAHYMGATVNRSNDLILVRARAPTFPDGGRTSVPDVRYWSLCENRKALQSVIACAADQKTAIDRDGFFYDVISVGNQPPGGADSAHGFTYLPFGDADPGFLIYRQILALPDFTGAISRVPAGGDPYVVLGDYAPVGVYCAADTFSAQVSAGASPSQVFAACVAAP